MYLSSPADFAGADDHQLGKGERAWDQDHRTHSLLFDYYWFSSTHKLAKYDCMGECGPV